MGISPQKIAKNAPLLGRNPETIRKNHNNLISLGIIPQKIASRAELLGINPETIQTYYNNLISLGITPQKINSYPGLLGRNPNTVSSNFRYLTNVINLEEKTVQKFPQLLLENPDAFAKKMRILKLEFLSLKRKNIFNPNKYAGFYLSSPATLIAKKKYYIDKKIDLISIITALSHPFKNLIKRVDCTLSDEQAKELGKKLIRPYKQRYDKWMKEYKKWAAKFAQRRGKRLILRV